MSCGARWLKADLHLHAPGQGQHYTMPSGQGIPRTEAERLQFAREYVRRAREVRGLDLIAITNHNDTSWIRPLQQTARELYGDDFVVLPGLEIATDSGHGSIHVLAIFSEDTPPEHVEWFLHDRLELPVERRFVNEHNTCPTSKSFVDTVRAITRDHGIAIAAHAFSTEDSLLSQDSNKGLSRETQFMCDDLVALDLAAFTLEQLATKSQGWGLRVVTNQHDAFKRPRPIALLNNSDSRRLDTIGERFTWFKGEKPCFKALKQALLNPEDRLRLSKAPPQGHDLLPRERAWMYTPPREPGRYLTRVRVDAAQGAFLHSIEVPVHPGLNCLIGGRGAGKSALIELLRYLWDQPRLIGATDGFENVFLPASARATAELVVDGHHYRVVRAGGEEPVVEMLTEQNCWERVQNLAPQALVRLHVYGQKEILETAKSMRSQLELLDRLAGYELEKLKEVEKDLREKLRRNREEVLGLFRQRERMLGELDSLPEVVEQLRRCYEHGIKEKAETKRRYDTEEQKWAEALHQLGNLHEILSQVSNQAHLDLRYLNDEELADLVNPAPLQRLQARLVDLSDRTLQQVKTAMQAVTGAEQDIAAWQAEWQTGRKAFEDEYREALRALPNASPDQIIRLEKRRSALEATQIEVERVEQQIRAKLDDRRGLLEGLLTNADDQCRVRETIASALSSQLEHVRVTVKPAGDESHLVDMLQTRLHGSRLRDVQYKTLAARARRSVLPLLAAIEQADRDVPESLRAYEAWLGSDVAQGDGAMELLAQTSGLDDLERAGKLVAYLGSETRLEMDDFITPDSVVVELNIAGPNEAPNWRAIGRELGQGVSVGQGCTAILSIILLDSQIPLIIDQPEDDLDNRFIYDEVVQILRRNRGNRQIILATHNANIPVAGDAEMIIALDAREDADATEGQVRCHVAAAGCVDSEPVRLHVMRILEGGEAAFHLRHQKYGF